MMKVLNGSIITILAVMFILLLCSCDDNKCRTFCKSEWVVSYDIKKESDFMVISEKWNNPRFDKEYKLLFINGEYYLDVDSSKELFLSTKRIVRKNYKEQLKNGIVSINIDKYNDTVFMAAIEERTAKSKSVYKLIYYNKSYDIVLIQAVPVLEDFTVCNRPNVIPFLCSLSKQDCETLLPSNDNIVSYNVVKDADSIVVYENKSSNRYGRKYKFIYNEGEYYWDNERGKEILVMSTKQEVDEEHCLPLMARPYRVEIKHAKGGDYITSIYTEGINKRLILRLYYDNSYDINKIQMEGCLGYAYKQDKDM